MGHTKWCATKMSNCFLPPPALTTTQHVIEVVARNREAVCEGKGGRYRVTSLSLSAHPHKKEQKKKEIKNGAFCIGRIARNRTPSVIRKNDDRQATQPNKYNHMAWPTLGHIHTHTGTGIAKKENTHTVTGLSCEDAEKT